MPRFEELGAAELDTLRHYLRARARGAPEALGYRGPSPHK
jgi:hypothetical protein